MNLKVETLNELQNNGKYVGDVVAVCGKDFAITWDNFISLADTDYDDGFGGQEVARDLKIIGKDFIMIRHEYDGAEGWSFIKTIPPENTRNVCCLTRGQATALREKFFIAKGLPEDNYDMYIESWGTLSEYDAQAIGEEIYS